MSCHTPFDKTDTAALRFCPCKAMQALIWQAPLSPRNSSPKASDYRSGLRGLELLDQELSSHWYFKAKTNARQR